MGDIFSTERAGFAERLARLMGGTTWREPLGGHGTAGDRVPDVHAMAAALAYARQGDADVRPDVAEAVIVRSLRKPARVCAWLAGELDRCCGRVAKRHADYLPMIARQAYIATVMGHDPATVEGMPARDSELLASVGMGLLWQAVDEALARAERAYRAAA